MFLACFSISHLKESGFSKLGRIVGLEFEKWWQIGLVSRGKFSGLETSREILGESATPGFLGGRSCFSRVSP